jgi:dipeptidyl aminopeptidase/acylaminoacyl peptidase
MRARPSALLSVIALLSFLPGCAVFPDHYLIHPAEPPPGIATWSEDVRRGALLVHLEWAQPPGGGPLPTVIVHPEGGKTAADMNGVIRDLAQQGYLAVAVDYMRLLDGAYRRNTFAWREQGDALAALEAIRAYPRVDRARIAALGFSQGGIFSLLMAAHSQDIKTVIAYYPVSDFRAWFDLERDSLGFRIAFSLIERHFRSESGAQTDEEFNAMLRRASAIYYVDAIRVPVLLIHGADDTSAPVGESERLAKALKELGREVELMVIPDAGHVFNFKQPEQARRAWDATLAWLRARL